MPGAMSGRGRRRATPLVEQTTASLIVECLMFSGFVAFFLWQPGSIMLEAGWDIFQKQPIGMFIITGVAFSVAFFAFVVIPALAVIQRGRELVRRMK
jgi:hypothetical protein